MTTVQSDPQKIEQLLNAATSERQRKMYQALLDKARKQERSSTKNKQPETIPSNEKTTQTKTKSSTKTQKKTKTVKKNQKVATQSTKKEDFIATKQSSKTVTESSSLSPASTTPEPAPSNIEPAPPTELKSQSTKSQKKQTAAKAPLFQALGTVIATPSLQDKLIKIAINGSEYNLLYAQGFRRQTYIKLKEELEKNGSRKMFLRVYPKVKYDYKSQQHRIAFSLVTFSSDCEKINDEPPGFMLRGIWQYIPQSKTPVISIYRNRETIDFFKKLNKTQQSFFAKPHHIPVVWDGPVEPFKYNPKVEKEARGVQAPGDTPGDSPSQMPRYFVEVRAIFKDGLFTVEEMLSEPTLKIPKFIKLSKSSASDSKF